MPSDIPNHHLTHLLKFQFRIPAMRIFSASQQKKMEGEFLDGSHDLFVLHMGEHSSCHLSHRGLGDHKPVLNPLPLRGPRNSLCSQAVIV